MEAKKKSKNKIDPTLKKMVEAVKKDNLEFKEENDFEETLTKMILKVSPHGTSYYVREKIQKENTNSKPQSKKQ